MRKIKLFITGTDTHVGKTYVSVHLLKLFTQLGYSTLGLKPIASGCIKENNVLYNEDALALQQASSIKLPYQTINPFAFAPAIAPHIAAHQVGLRLSVNDLNEKMKFALSHAADFCLIEGAGGWYTPLNETETLADFVIQQQLPTVLVVGMRLGCLNHALLTHKAMQQDGVNIIGWIANCPIANMPYCEENIKSLQKNLTSPCLSVISHHESLSFTLSSCAPFVIPCEGTGPKLNI